MNITPEIEAVARAIYEAYPIYIRRHANESDDEAARISFDALSDADLNIRIEQAIAAIRALRAPTQAMIDAGAAYILSVGCIESITAHDRNDPPQYVKGRETGSRELYQTMIGAALGEHHDA